MNDKINCCYLGRENQINIYLIFFQISLLYAFPLAATPVNTEIQYPRDPCLSQSFIFTGSNGINRYNSKALEKVKNLEKVMTYEPTCAQKTIYIGSKRGLYAFSVESGDQLWTFGKGLDIYSPTVEGESVYVSSNEGLLVKLHGKDGKVVWKVKTDGWIFPPVVIGDVVVVGGQNMMVFAFDKRTGRAIWEKKLSQEVIYRLSTDGNKLVFATTYDRKIFALNKDSGNIVWESNTPEAVYTPLVTPELIILGDQTGSVHALSKKSGKKVWQQKIGGRILSSPSLLDGYHQLLSISSTSGRVAILNIKTGKLIWSKSGLSKKPYTPLSIGNSILVKDSFEELSILNINLKGK